MAKCNGCGRFIGATADVAKCGKCQSIYHRPCVGLTANSSVSTSWCCPNCKPKKVIDADTPVKSLHGEGTDNDALNYNVQSSRPHAATSPAAGEESSLLRADFKQISEENSLLLAQLKEFRGENHHLLEQFKVVREENSRLLAQFKEIRADFHGLLHDIESYKNEVAQLKNTVTLNSSKLNTLDTRMDALENNVQTSQQSSVNKLNAEILQLRQELNERDQLSLANDVEISGLAEEAGENSSHLASLIGAKLGIKIEDRDLIFAERVGPLRESSTIIPGDSQVARDARPRPRPLVFRFVRRELREDFVRAARVRRGITASDLGFAGGDMGRFYVNERLSKHNKQIFYHARQLCREHNWKFVWTKSGITHVRQAQGESAYRVTSIANLNSIFGVE